jgi:O-antigen/teichoic acid export membrane protein
MTAWFPQLRRVALDSSLTLILKCLALPLGYLSNILLARWFGAEDMGCYFIAVSLLGLLATLGVLGLDKGLLRFIAVEAVSGGRGAYGRLLWPAAGGLVILNAAVALALLGGSEALARWLKAPQLPALLWLAAWALPLAVAGRLLAEALRGLNGVRLVAFQENILYPGSALALLALAAYWGLGRLPVPHTLGAIYLAITAISLIFLWLCLPASQGDSASMAPQASLGAVMRYSWPIYLNSLAGLGLNYADSLILAAFSSPREVAYYGVANRLAPLANFPLLAVNAVVLPMFAQLHQQGDRSGLEFLAQNTARWMYYLALPITLLLMGLGPWLLRWFGGEFGQAHLALIILALGNLVNVAAGSVGAMLNMTGNQWAMVRAQLLAGLGTIPLLCLLAPWQGLNGVALAMALGVVAANLFMTLAVWRQLGVKAHAQGLRRANLAGMAAIGLFYAIKPFGGYLGATALFATAYVAILWKPLKEELALIQRHLPWREATG